MTIVHSSSQLAFIEQDVRRRYRPAKFRQVLGSFINRQVPTWAEKIEIRKINDFARLLPLQMKGGQLPMPDIERTPSTFVLADFGCAYEVFDDEVERAERTGINVDSERAMANARAAEQLLDEIAAKGDPFGISLPGVFNSADVPTVTAVTKAAGGTTWAVATADEIVTDLHALVNAVAENSLENFTGTLVTLPVAQYHLAIEKRNTNTDRNALQLFLEQNPYVQSVVPWDRSALLGAGTTPRAMAIDASAGEEIGSLYIPRELQSEAPMRIPFGVRVDQRMKTGGFVFKAPKGAAYMDAI